VGIFRKLIDSIAGNKSKPIDASFPGDQVATHPRQRRDAFAEKEEPRSASPPTLLIQEKSPLSAQSPDPLLQCSDVVLDEMIDELDAAFDKACSLPPGNDTGHAELQADEEASIQSLFAEITAAYAAPLKNFIFDLHRHAATRDSIEFCRPLLRSIRSAAEKINLPETVHRMEKFDRSLALGQEDADLCLEGEVRDKILSDYDSLSELLPESFHIGDENLKREDIIIRSLLEDVPGVGCVTIEKLYESGLGSLQTLLLANPEDLAAATAIRRPLCEKICLKMKKYSGESEVRPRNSGQSRHRSCLAEIVNELRKLGDAEGIGRNPDPGKSPEVEKRERRKQRIGLFLEAKVILAEVGELDLIRKLEKASFKKRVHLLDEHLAYWKTDSI
jgi:hypothetical protein